MNLHEMLKLHRGREVHILLNRQAPMEINGRVEMEGEQIVLVSDRIERPMPGGQMQLDPKTRQPMVVMMLIPRNVIYLNDLRDEDVFYVRVFTETQEEARKAIELERPRIAQVETQINPTALFNPRGGR